MRTILFVLALLGAVVGRAQIFLDWYGAAAPPATLLLDEYQNAAAAYSLRLLRTAYTGNCIEVRKASDNTTQNIGFVGGVLDTAALKTFCASTNCFVRTWYDQSGNNRNITQATATAQPTIVVNGVVQRAGGEPCANFDGSSDWMRIAFNLGATQTRLAVLQHNSAQNNGVIIFDDGANDDIAYLLFSTTNTLRFATLGANIFTSPVLNGTPFVSTGVYAAGAGVLAANNLTPATGSPSTVTYSGITIASRRTAPQFLSNINLQEIVIYSTNRTADISGMHANVNAFYSVY
jgi:hypothetical protein